MKTTRSAARRANPISWVTTSMVIPSAASPVITASTSLIISGSSALVGSSNSITLGFIASDRAMATRCCCPPESCAGYFPAWSATPTRSSNAIASRRASPGRSLRTFTGPSVTFSSTVLWANRLNDWKTIPTSDRNRASLRPSAASCRPSMAIVPESTVSSRLIVRHNVDLPDPDGPRTTTTWPGSTSRVMSLRTCNGPKCLLTPRIEIIGAAAPPAMRPDPTAVSQARSPLRSMWA